MPFPGLLSLLHEKFDGLVFFLNDFFFTVEYICEFILIVSFGVGEFLLEGVNFAFLSLDNGL